MILAKDEILKRIKSGKIKITPYSTSNLGPASYDLTLGNEFRTYSGGRDIAVSEATDYKKFSKIRKGSIKLKPDSFVLAVTKEKITLADDICGWLSGRSRFARLGLQIHSTAAFMQPGIDNHQVLEIYNLSKNTLELKPGTRICQIIFERAEGKARYKGKFAKQKL
jgi:dCTP deaminase